MRRYCDKCYKLFERNDFEIPSYPYCCKTWLMDKRWRMDEQK